MFSYTEKYTESKSNIKNNIFLLQNKPTMTKYFRFVGLFGKVWKRLDLFEDIQKYMFYFVLCISSIFYIYVIFVFLLFWIFCTFLYFIYFVYISSYILYTNRYINRYIHEQIPELQIISDNEYKVSLAWTTPSKLLLPRAGIGDRIKGAAMPDRIKQILVGFNESKW